MIRILSIILVTLTVAAAASLYGLVGALAALPAAVLISYASEKLIARFTPPQVAKRRATPPGL